MANDKGFIQRAFAEIAPNYDRLNSILSLGAEARWRKRTVALLDPAPGETILDLCAGTLTLSRDLDRHAQGRARLCCVDFCFEMLALGQDRLPREDRPRFPSVCGDAERLPLESASFNAALVAYGVRNWADQNRGLKELFRVLRPGGRLVILDFLRPSLPGFAPLYRIYLKRVLPCLGGFISGSRDAYQHLTDSIESFMEPDVLNRLLVTAGFEQPRVKKLTLGVAGLFIARKPIT